MRSRKGFTLIELVVVVTILGVLAAIGLENWISMQARAKEASVKSNAHTVQLTVEDFAVQNEGVYATDRTTPALSSGQKLVDLFPTNMTNPFDPAGNVVVDGAPGADGEIGYDTAGKVGFGYTIGGKGEGGQVVITLTNGS